MSTNRRSLIAIDAVAAVTIAVVVGGVGFSDRIALLLFFDMTRLRCGIRSPFEQTETTRRAWCGR